jgi:hypothetical protein
MSKIVKVSGGDYRIEVQGTLNPATGLPTTGGNIILDTARTDTLSCYPSCDTAIYGKGEASLSRALAPVGRLR